MENREYEVESAKRAVHGLLDQIGKWEEDPTETNYKGVLAYVALVMLGVGDWMAREAKKAMDEISSED